MESHHKIVRLVAKWLVTCHDVTVIVLPSAIAGVARCTIALLIITTAHASPAPAIYTYQMQKWDEGKSISVAGVVSDIFDHLLFGVNVTLSGDITYQTQTNSRGEYVFPSVLTGTYSITFEDNSYIVVSLHDLELKGTKETGFYPQKGESVFFQIDCPMLPLIPGGYTHTRSECTYSNGPRMWVGMRQMQTWAAWESNHGIKRPASGLIAGNILDPHGTGVGDADVIISRIPESSNVSPYTVHATTARNGVYSAVVEKGKYEIKLSKGGYFSASGIRDVSGFSSFNGILVPAHSAPAWLTTLLDNGWKVFATQALLWLLLIVFYPTSPSVQAFFFWNRWARKAFGFMYVDFLLTWVPFLRSRLLTPFRNDLIAEAQNQDKGLAFYFPECDVAEPDGANRTNINEALATVRGQIVLEGESGLGKSMFLRRLVTTARSPHVYLKAESCDVGVLPAIQLRLKGKASDEAFLKSIIYTGGLTFIIDGLNEVTVEVREKIISFVNTYSKANILLATQPMQWKAPAATTILRMMPLAEDKIQRFLESRYCAMEIQPTLDEKEYLTKCAEYIGSIQKDSVASEERSDALRTLSNPMDLTTAAGILLRGGVPTPGNLQAQEFTQMDQVYRRNNGGQAFPIRAFSESVYLSSIKDEVLSLDSQTFLSEIRELSRFKMVLEQHSEDDKGAPVRRWIFRHEKIRDFFLMQAFLAKDGERIPLHLDDARFRNVYVMLASVLSLDQALDLREALVDRAAETKEHHLSDVVVQILRARRFAASDGKEESFHPGGQETTKN